MLSLSRLTWIRERENETFLSFFLSLGRQQHGVYNNNQKEHNLDTCYINI